MGDVRMEWNDAAFRAFLKSPEVRAVVTEKAQEVLNRCPDIGFGMTIGETNQRARAFVGTRSTYAERHNNKHDTLRRALG